MPRDAEEGTVSRAASRIGVAQPSLSKQIHELEREVGYPLFTRGPRGVTLTGAGRALLGHVRQVLVLVSDTSNVVARGARNDETVSLGVPPGLSPGWLRDAVAAVRVTCPAVVVRLTEAGSAAQLRRLAEGDLDRALVHQTPPVPNISERLWAVPLGMAVRPGHPLAQRDAYRLDDLNRLRVLAHSPVQIPTQQEALVAATMTAQVWPRWQFCEFVEHVLACAEGTGCDAALFSQETASARLPDWVWKPIEGIGVAMTTWLAWGQERVAHHTGGSRCHPGPGEGQPRAPHRGRCRRLRRGAHGSAPSQSDPVS